MIVCLILCILLAISLTITIIGVILDYLDYEIGDTLMDYGLVAIMLLLVISLFVILIFYASHR